LASFGEELRRERELRGISLREVAEATKINIRFLEALERNDFASLHGGLYNRGIVRAYCEFIGADAEGMVNAYLLEERGPASPYPAAAEAGLLRGRQRAAGPPARSGAAAAAPRAARSGRWLLLALILAALFACLLLYIRFTGAREVPPWDVEPQAEQPSGGAGGGGV
jgi:cytoskeletal protein RodZ